MPVPSGVVVRIDLDGSTYTRGVTSYRYDRVIRRCLVTGLAASSGSSPLGGVNPDEHDLLHRAAEAAVIGNLFHHIVTDLPLQQVRARPFLRSPTKAWVDLLYARGRWGSFPSGSPANVIGSYRSKDMPIPVYELPYVPQGDGSSIPKFDPITHLPDGPLYIIKKTNTGVGGRDADHIYRRPQTYMWPRPAVEFFLPTFKSYDPLDRIDHLIGKTNDGPIRIGTLDFAVNTLLLKGPDLDWTQNRNGDWFEVDFRLIGIPTGFFVQHILIAESGPNVGEWVAVDGPQFEQADFTPLTAIF